MPLKRLSYFAYVISRKQSTNQQKQLQKDAFHVTTTQLAKTQLDSTKNEK